MIRFRWKRLLIPAVLAGIMFVAPDDSLGQRGGFGGGGGPGGGGGFGGGAPGGGGPGGGGPGGGGRGGFNMGAMADSSFDRLVRSYGGSGDSLDYSKIPNDVREQTNMMNQRFGSPPLPSSGSVSRVEFKAEVEKRMAARMGGGAAPTATPAAAPGGGDKVVVLGPGGPTDGKTMTMTMTPGGGGPGSPGGFGGGGGGFGGGGMGGGFGGRGGGGDQMNPESRFKEMDKNQDGKISKDEAANGSRRLAGAFEQNDTNKDGSIDLAEYTAYFTAATQGMGGGGGPGGGGPGGWGGGGGWGSREEKKLEEQDEPKPVVYRYGYLPQGLPAYFLDADSDKDGQVGLYEWVKYWDTTEAKLTEFKSLDQNGDGLLTVEEYMRVKKINPQELAAKGAPGRGGAPAWGQPQPPAEGAPVSPGAALEDQTKKDERNRDSSKETKKEDKKEEKKDERRDPRSGGTDPRSGGGDTRSPGGFGQRPTGDTRGTTPGGTPPGGTTPGGGRFPGGGGGNQFNPGGPTGGRPGGGR